MDIDDLEQPLIRVKTIGEADQAEVVLHLPDTIAKVSSVPLVLVVCCHYILILGDVDIRPYALGLKISYFVGGIAALLGTIVACCHQSYRLNFLEWLRNANWQEHFLDAALFVTLNGVFFFMKALAGYLLPSADP